MTIELASTLVGAFSWEKIVWFYSFNIKLVYTSNIRNVSLTYLRGLEIAELKEEDMPMV